MFMCTKSPSLEAGDRDRGLQLELAALLGLSEAVLGRPTLLPLEQGLPPAPAPSHPTVHPPRLLSLRHKTDLAGLLLLPHPADRIAPGPGVAGGGAGGHALPGGLAGGAADHAARAQVACDGVGVLQLQWKGDGCC